MKIIITENQNSRLMVKRRHQEIRDLAENTYTYLHPCLNDDVVSFLDDLIDDIRFGKDFLEWITNDNFIEVSDFIRTVMKNDLENRYYSKCRK